jgi:hypothetical protein
VYFRGGGGAVVDVYIKYFVEEQFGDCYKTSLLAANRKNYGHRIQSGFVDGTSCSQSTIYKEITTKKLSTMN